MSEMHIPIWAFVLWTLAWGTIGVGVAALVSATRVKVVRCEAARQEKLADHWREDATESKREVISLLRERQRLEDMLATLEAQAQEPAVAPATMEATGG